MGELRRGIPGSLILILSLSLSLFVAPGAQETQPAPDRVAPPADSVPAEAGRDASGDAAEAAAGEEEPYAEPAPPLFMESYTEGAYSKHEEDNTSGFSDLKVGKRFDLGRPVDVYLKARMHRDARDFFWNNHLDAGIGARVGLLRKVSLVFFAEAMTGLYYRTSATVGDLAGIQARLDRNRAAVDGIQGRFQGTVRSHFDRWVNDDTTLTKKELDSLFTAAETHYGSLSALDAYLDSLETTRDSLRQVGDSLALIPAGPLTEYRGGFVFWYGTPQAEHPGGGFNFPMRFWCDLYAEGLVSLQRRTVRTRGGGGETYRDSTARFDNFILYLNPDVGMLLVEGAGGSLVAYGALYAWFDTHRDWWNNRAMAGPGVRHKPFRSLDLTLACEYLWGGYYGRERDEDPNPYSRTFTDVRLLASFWYGLGF